MMDNIHAIITATIHRAADFKPGKCIRLSPWMKAAVEDGRASLSTVVTQNRKPGFHFSQFPD
jgi:hypothetical protein